VSSTPRQYLALVTKEETSDWNVVFPDLPGCVTAGRSLDEAVTFAEEALALHVHGLREDGEDLPSASKIENVMADPESAGALLYLVPLKPLKGRLSRVNITLDEYLLAEIDSAAKQVGSNRSKFLAAAARRALDDQAAISHPPATPAMGTPSADVGAG
jgi:predicted RNase H-like HicB family nuclease